MTPDDRHADDPLLARVAAARPPVDDADLSPDGPRAEAILARVLASPREQPAPVRTRRAPWWSRWRLRAPAVGVGALGLAAAAVVVVLVVGVGGGTSHRRAPTGLVITLPAADHIKSNGSPFIPRDERIILDRTPLGRAIAQQYQLTQENIDTGGPAQNRRLLQQLQFNQQACEHAAVVVSAIRVPPAQRFVQYDWVRGIRMQARMDGLFITALRDFAAGHRAAGQRAFDAAGNLSNASDTFTAYSQDWLGGNRLPFPHGTPGLRGPGGRVAR